MIRRPPAYAIQSAALETFDRDGCQWAGNLGEASARANISMETEGAQSVWAVPLDGEPYKLLTIDTLSISPQ
jgi:hypothetical protein